MNAVRRRLVAGNWKMHGSLAANQLLLEAIRRSLTADSRLDVSVCVPAPYLAQAAGLLSGSRLIWGGQDVSAHDVGAYTGEISGAMLKEFGCRHVIVGHSERRQFHAENDSQVAAKFVAAQRNGLVPILCVGETLEQRERGDTETVVARQLDAVIDVAGVSAMREAVVAYEPVWAIGTGKTATSAQAQAVHRFLRERVAVQDVEIAGGLVLIYGGSVKPSNAAELFSQPDVDGGLVGGAALVAGDFVAICRAAEGV